MALAPWIAPAVVATYVHNVGVRLRREFRGHTRHPGDAAAIVRACIDACWNGRTFTASPGHFDMFWTRDLSFSVPSLIRLGHGERVHRSLAHALDVWARRRSHITTTIHYFDRPGDVFEYGVDSLPLFLAALRTADATTSWNATARGSRPRSPTTTTPSSTREAGSSARIASSAPTATPSSIDPTRSGTRWSRCWPRRSRRPAGSPRHSSVISRVTTAACSSSTSGSSDHFRDALGDETVSGEANIWPFYTGVMADPLRVAAALRYLDANGFCDPYPLRYETSRRPEREVWLTRHVLPDYQGSTVWTSLGAMYLQVLRTVDPLLAASETARYVSWIERDGTFWEVMNASGQNWVSPRWIMIGEESMLWSAIFLDALENLDLRPAYLSESLPIVEAVAA